MLTRKLKKVSVFCLASMCGGVAFAGDLGLMFKPYIGFDIQSARWDFADGFGKNRLPKSAFQGHFVLGASVHDYLDVEVGFESSQKKENTVSGSYIVAGTNVLGAVATADQRDPGAVNHFTIRQQALTLDFMPKWSMPGHEEVTLFGVIGASSENINASTFIINNGGVDTRPVQLTSKTKRVLRLGAGAKYAFSDNAGVRASVVWKKWSGMNLTGGPDQAIAAIPASTVKMRNGYQAGIGVYAYL